MSRKSKRKKTKRTRRRDYGERPASPDIVFRFKDERVYLFQIKDPNGPTKPHWFKAGGTIYQAEFSTERTLRRESVDSTDSLEPPENALRVLSVFLKADEREAVLGDLAEKYQQKCKQLGQLKANRWIYGQVARSLVPFILRLIGKIVWFILGAWIKKHIS